MCDGDQAIRPGVNVITLLDELGTVVSHPGDDQGYVLVKLQSGRTRKFWAWNLFLYLGAIPT